jgi:hypothetical protein
LDVVTNAVIGAVVQVAPIVAAGTVDSVTLADNSVYYVSMNGAADNLTTAGLGNTLSTSDMTVATLTNLAAYLDERFVGTAVNTVDAVIVINWTAGGSTTSYVYEYVEANANDTIQGTELTLIGVVDRGTTVLTTGDVI